MKKFISSFLLLLSFIVFQSCHRENVAPAKGSVSFSHTQGNRGGRVHATSTPAFVLLSIEGTQGNSIEENKKLALYSFNSTYITEDLKLNTGNYKLTKFVILDAANKIIYATPTEGSDLAKYVSDPLPIHFTITENGSTKVIPQVLAVEEQDKPETFGYASFGFEVVKPVSKLIKKILLEELQGGVSIKHRMDYKYEDNKSVVIEEFYCYPDWNSGSLTSRVALLFDQAGRLEKHTFESNNGEKTIREFQYDNLGRLVKIVNDQGYNWDKKTEFFYEGAGTIPVYALISPNTGPGLAYRLEYQWNETKHELKIDTYIITNGGKKKQQSKSYVFDGKKRVYPNSFDFSTAPTFVLGVDEFPVDLGNITSLAFTWYSYTKTSDGEQMITNNCYQSEIKHDFNDLGLISSESFHTSDSDCSDYSVYPDGTILKYQYSFY